MECERVAGWKVAVVECERMAGGRWLWWSVRGWEVAV